MEISYQGKVRMTADLAVANYLDDSNHVQERE